MQRKYVVGGSAVGVAALLLVVVFVFLISNLDSIIEVAVEEEGSAVTQVQVTLGEADISPASGKGALRNLVVANPKGYKTPTAFSLGEVAVDIDIGTLANDVVVINAITVTKPQITYEIGGKAGTNLDAIRRNVANYLGPATKDGKTPAGKAEKGGDGPKFIIRNLYVRDGSVSVSAVGLGGKKLTAGLPDIHLKDIGKKSGGASPGEVIEQLLDEVGGGAGKSVASLDLKGLLNSGGKAVGGVAETVVGKGGIVQTGADSLGKSINKLFGK